MPGGGDVEAVKGEDLADGVDCHRSGEAGVERRR
jgi:hypothetical protein